MSVATVDQTKLMEFVGKFVGDLGATLHAPLVLIGDRLGLYKAMADAGPLTPAELASQTGTNERYVARVAQRPGGERLREYDAQRPNCSPPSRRSRSPTTTAPRKSRAPSSSRWR